MTTENVIFETENGKLTKGHNDTLVVWSVDVKNASGFKKQLALKMEEVLSGTEKDFWGEFGCWVFNSKAESNAFFAQLGK
jgi:hypothetical protein